ncbi:MAG: hypothetical protein JNK18_01650 [Cyclobacteriaceae bacterium]|nr:hypothetical protein [Cyclobacteriaceae bacterium]
MTKYFIPILTFILFLFGFLIFFSSILYWGIGTYTAILTFSTLIGFIALLAKRTAGLTVMFFVCSGWLLRYFEHAGFLTLYDSQNLGRWVIVMIPILLSTIILTLTYKARQDIKEKPFSLKFPTLLIIGIAAIGLLSFVRKPHTNEFNCWYYIDNDKQDYKITFAITPDHIFETTTDSKELKEFVLKYGIRDEFRPGIYCPETKVRVVKRFNKIISAKILGFRNSTTDYEATLDEPFEIDVNEIYGDKGILEPQFRLGD